MKISGAYLNKIDFFWQWEISFLKQNLNSFIHVKPLKQLQIHDETKNRLNTLLHRLFGGLLEVPTKYYVKSKMICDYIN